MEKIPEKEATKNAKSFNYGLAILKSILAFLVVRHHTFQPNTTKNKIILFITKERFFHVPSFFILSFFFMSNNLLSLNPKVIINRLMRLLIPYIGWPIIILKINHLFKVKYHRNFPDTYSYLKIQYLWGIGIISPLWFIWSLIVMTFIFIIVIFIFRKHALFIFQLILILTYVGQYSGYTHKAIFMKYPNYNKTTVGYTFISIPYAVTGFTLAYFKIIDLLQKYKIKTFILSILIYNVIADYNIFIDLTRIAYQGIDLNIKSVCVIFIFSLFPSENIKNKYLEKFLKLITNYTGGVYYIHIPIKEYSSYYIDSIKHRTFSGVIILYLICYFICFVGMLIFGKTPIKYFFH